MRRGMRPHRAISLAPAVEGRGQRRDPRGLCRTLQQPEIAVAGGKDGGGRTVISRGDVLAPRRIPSGFIMFENLADIAHPAMRGNPCNAKAGGLEKLEEGEHLVPQEHVVVDQLVKIQNRPRTQPLAEAEQHLARRAVNIAIDADEGDATTVFPQKGRDRVGKPTRDEPTIRRRAGRRFPSRQRSGSIMATAHRHEDGSHGMEPKHNPVSPFRLDGKIALVTGAGRGIGRGVALALAGAGAEVLLNSRTPAQLDAVAGEIAAQGGRASPLPFDVTDSEAACHAIAGIDRLDILVNNAGMNRPQPFLEVDDATLDRMIALNIKAAFFLARPAASLVSGSSLLADGGWTAW